MVGKTVEYPFREPAYFVRERKMLRGIRKRAEEAVREEPVPTT